MLFWMAVVTAVSSQLCRLPGGSFLTWVPLSQRPLMLCYFERGVTKGEITRVLSLEVGLDGGELLPTLLSQGCSQPAWTLMKKMKEQEVCAPGMLGERRGMM